MDPRFFRLLSSLQNFSTRQSCVIRMTNRAGVAELTWVLGRQPTRGEGCSCNGTISVRRGAGWGHAAARRSLQPQILRELASLPFTWVLRGGLLILLFLVPASPSTSHRTISEYLAVSRA